MPYIRVFLDENRFFSRLCVLKNGGSLETTSTVPLVAVNILSVIYPVLMDTVLCFLLTLKCPLSSIFTQTENTKTHRHEAVHRPTGMAIIILIKVLLQFKKKNLIEKSNEIVVSNPYLCWIHKITLKPLKLYLIKNDI